MKVLLWESTNQVANLIMSKLIQIGIVPLIVNDMNLIIPTLRSKEYKLMLTDIPADENDKILGIISSIKKDKKLTKINIVCHVKNIKKDVMKKLILLGVCGFIPKPINEKVFIPRFNRILDQIYLKGMNRRSQIRVTPQDEEDVQMTCRLPPDYKLVFGKVINISIQGFLCYVSEGKNKLITVGQNLDFLIIKLPKAQLQAKALVVAKKEQFIGFRLIELNTHCKDALSQYIYNNLINSQF